jgi:hypothetical protein
VADDQRLPDEEERFVEAAVSTIAAGAPSDWVTMHAEFALTAASATVDTESEAEPVALDVSQEALRDIALHQQWAVEHGRPWRRLIIDYERSGRLTVRAVSVGASMLSRITWALWLLAAVALIATVVLFFVR